MNSSNPELTSKIQLDVRKELERNLIAHGDDGLLEYMLEWSQRDASKDSRKAGIAHITRSLLERKLY